eukprot:4817260-Prymnesium_polylepis.1
MQTTLGIADRGRGCLTTPPSAVLAYATRHACPSSLAWVRPMPPAAKTNSLGFDVITQYRGQEQVDLVVEIDIPGSWFGGGAQ